MAALIFIVITSLAMGYLLLRQLKMLQASLWKNIVLASSLGMGGWCFFLFGAGHLGMLDKEVFFVTGIALTIAAIIVAGKGGLPRINPIKIPELSWFEWTLCITMAGIIAVSFLSCFAPVVGGVRNDEILYHLSVPSQWLSRGAIATDGQGVMFLVGNGELLFLLAECFSMETGPHLISLLSFFLCLAVVYYIAEQHAGRTVGIVSAGIAAINPLVFRDASIAFVDLLSSLYVLLPVWVLFMYRENRRYRYLFLAAFFMGVGIGIKPTNYLYALSIMLFALIVFIADRIPLTVNKSLFVVLAALLFSLPWPARNIALTGSPVFPPPLFLTNAGLQKPLLADSIPYSMAEVRKLYDYCNSRFGDHQRNLKNLILLPWLMTMDSARFQIGDSMGSVLLSLLPLALCLVFYKRVRWAGLLAVVSLCSAIPIYFFVLPEARYFLGAYLLLCPVMACTLLKRYSPRPVILTAQAVIMVNALFVSLVVVRIHGEKAICFFDKGQRAHYIQALRPYAEAFGFCSTQPKVDIVVLRPNHIFYYLHRKYVVDKDALLHPEQYTGALLLDIDYSQHLHRDLTNQACDYMIKDPVTFLKKEFTGPDARVYRFLKQGAPE